MAADILLSTDRPWQKGTPERIASRVARIPNAARIDSIEMVTMARPVDERAGITKVVELRAVQPGFPFYGRLTLQDGRPYSHSLLQNNGALVRPELLAQFGLTVGDAIAIGKVAVRRPRRHRARARALAQRVQPRAARAHRLRRSRRDGAAGVRQPRRRARCCFAFPRPRSTRSRASCRPSCGRSSCACARIAIVRSRSARTSSAPRTISASSASSSSCSAASRCRA